MKPVLDATAGNRMMYCPNCETILENFSHEEGGWCPKCKEWFPFDLVIEEESNPYWGDDLEGSFYEK